MKTTPRYLPGVCLGLIALSFLPRAQAAEFEYAYAQQTVTNVVVTGAGIANTAAQASSTQSSATDKSGGTTSSAPTDALQSYIGTAPSSPQNNFTKYSTMGGGPQSGDFSRGDALLTLPGNLFSTGATASAVAEAFNSFGGAASSGSNSTRTGAGSWSLAGSFTGPTTSSLTISYSFANDIIAEAFGVGPAIIANAVFALTVAVADQHGHMVSANPSILNRSLTSPPNGPEFITSGTGSVNLSLGGLTAGDTYTVTITGSANVMATNGTAPVAAPEGGATILLLGLGALALFTLRRQTRKLAHS